MLRITKQTDYGIVLLTHMAGQPDRRVNAPELAEEAQLPLPMVSKILKLLARGGLLESHRGVNGGYQLARSPESVSVAEIITALEGPIAVTECVDDAPGLCPQESVCPLRSNWNRINFAIRNALDAIALSEMTSPIRLAQLPQRAVLPVQAAGRASARTNASSSPDQPERIEQENVGAA